MPTALRNHSTTLKVANIEAASNFHQIIVRHKLKWFRKYTLLTTCILGQTLFDNFRVLRVQNL